MGSEIVIATVGVPAIVIESRCQGNFYYAAVRARCFQGDDAIKKAYASVRPDAADSPTRLPREAATAALSKHPNQHGQKQHVGEHQSRHFCWVHFKLPGKHGPTCWMPDR